MKKLNLKKSTLKWSRGADTESEVLSTESKKAVPQQLNQSELNKNHEDLVNNLLSAFHNLVCHFLFSHLEKFPENLGAVNDEQGDRFHQNLMAV